MNVPARARALAAALGRAVGRADRHQTRLAELNTDVGSVRATVRGCRRDLGGVPSGALPELVERLARQRIIDSLAATSMV